MPRWIWVGDAVLFFAFFVLVPAIAFVIGRAAWRGKPKNWDRSMFWTAFVVSIVFSGFLMVYAQQMHVDLNTWQYPGQLALFGLGVLLFGVAGGFFVGIFLYRRAKGPIWRGAEPQSEDETEKATFEDHR